MSDTNKDSVPRNSIKKPTMVASIACALAGLTCIVLLFIFLGQRNNSQIIDNNTDPIFAEIGLKNLAVGMRTYSSMTGGGGNIMFTRDISKIRDYVMQEAFQALQTDNPTPYHGYVFELMENPIGDDYRNNFLFIARPANGFVGQAFQIDKFEKIQPLISDN